MFEIVKDRKFLSLLFMSLFFSLVLLLLFPQKSSALTGDATGSIPNNGDNPWLVVTRPGGNGMNAPASSTPVYVPTSVGLTFDMTITDACDNTTNDNDGWSNDTVFIFADTSQVSNVTSLSPGTAAFVYLGAWMVRCDTGTSSTVRVTMSSSIGQTTIGSTTYRRFTLRSELSNPSTNYYVNRFRMSAGSGIIIAFNSPSSAPSTAQEYTGIAYNIGAPNSWGWSTTLSFALPCNAGPRNSVVYFYDTDHQSGLGVPSSPYWQSGSYPMLYTIREYNRQNDALVRTIYTDEWLTGGQNQHESTFAFTMSSQYKYSITVRNINFVNSIQIALPVNPIYSIDPCNPPPVSCNVTPATISATPGNNFSVPITFGNLGGIGAGDRNNGLHLGIAEQGNPSTWNASGVPNPPPDNQSTFIPQNSGLSNASYYEEPSGGFTYRRYWVPNPNVGSTVTIRAPSTPGTRTLVVRLLSRTTPGQWLPNYCTVVVTTDPPVPTGVNCPSYPPYTLNFNTVQRIDLPRTPAGGPGHDTSPWTYQNVASSSGPTISGGAYNGSLNNVTATSQTRDVYQNYTYTRRVYLTQVWRQPTTPHRTIIDSIVDEWGDDLGIPYIRKSGNNDYIYLDYREYFDNYPYEEHNAVITYRIGYERYQRVGYIDQTVTVTQSGTATRTRANATSPWGPYSYSWGGVPGPGWTIPASPSTITTNDNLSYTGRRDASNPILWSGATTLDAPLMPPCYPREYSVTPTAGAATYIGGRESPTGSTFSFTLPTVLSYSNGGQLRTPTIVNGISYTVSYAAEGYSNPSFSGSFSRTVNISNSNRANNVTGTHTPSPLGETITLSVPANIQAGDRICWTVSVAEPIGTVRAGVVNGSIWNGSGPVRTASECTPLAVDQPYSRYYGADVFAGGGVEQLDGSCSATVGNAELRGAMRFDQLSGTGTQLAAFALGQIQQLQPLSQTTRNPLELAFANFNTSYGRSEPNRLYGGGFGSVACVNDYFASIPGDTNWDTSTANVNIGNLLAGKYYYEGDVNIFGQIPEVVEGGFGRRVVIYVRGDATIRMNAAGTGPAGRVGFANNTNWPSLEAVPSLYIIVEGNIFIDNDVNEIDGVLIAQPDSSGNGGEIETCNINRTTLLPTASNVNSVSLLCRNQLVINGALSAKQIHNIRTLGSLRESVPLEGFASTRAAESVIYNPTLWFSSSQLPPEDDVQIDSYIQLPPAL